MSKSILAAWADRLMIVGGICFALTSISQLQPGSHYVLTGIYQISMWFLGPAYLLIAMACFGLPSRYPEQFAPLARTTLIVAGGGAVAAIGGFMLVTTVSDVFRVLTMLGLVLHVVGMGVFGIANVNRPALPMPRTLPLLTSFLPLLMLLNTQDPLYGGANWGAFAYLMGAGAAWIAMGLLINREKQVNVQPAAA